MKTKIKIFLITLLFLYFLALASPLDAYVGPGAGFAFLSSFLVLFITFILAVFSFLSWPFRLLIKLMRGQKAYKKSRVDQLVIVGLDGMEPTLVEKFMAEGNLPNLSRLKKEGTYAHLKTTTPAISPVAWSSFMTGSHPCKHNIFDFLSRNTKNYLPELSSAWIGNPKKFLPLGKYKIPLSKPIIKGMRKSIPFWKFLGDAGIFSTIIRIPVTFPPEKFKGHLISGMCAPDLKGSQGTFTFYTSEKEKTKIDEGGVIIPLTISDNKIETYIPGPENSLLKKEEELKLPLKITLDSTNKTANLNISGKKFTLKEKTLSDWVKITFRPGLGIKVRAICRFFISEISPNFMMYISPLNIDPEKPALPISHPFIYSVYIAKLLGSYTTLGEADDTWALNEGILDEDTFIKLAYDNHKESEDMLFNAIDKTKKGVVACWFQVTDSMQHMFFRYLDKKHPALKFGQNIKSAKTIEELYLNMDKLVGKVRDKLSKNSCLVIMSDHGFKQFRRGVNLNSWFYCNGYLNLKDGKSESGEWLKDVDWIIEVVVERLDIKQRVFEKVESVLTPGTIVTSNTSGLSARAMSEGRSENFRKHFAITHFFNPPRYMKLLELVPGPDTLPEVMEVLAEVCERVLGKGIVYAKDTPNFIANRIGIFSAFNVMRVMMEMGLSIEAVDKLTGPVIGNPKSASFRTGDQESAGAAGKSSPSLPHDAGVCQAQILLAA